MDKELVEILTRCVEKVGIAKTWAMILSAWADVKKSAAGQSFVSIAGEIGVKTLEVGQTVKVPNVKPGSERWLSIVRSVDRHAKKTGKAFGYSGSRTEMVIVRTW